MLRCYTGGAHAIHRGYVFTHKKDGKLIGISLVAEPQTEAEMFCSSFPKQLTKRKGRIIVLLGKVAFINPMERAFVLFAIEDEDASNLNSMLHDESITLGLYNDGILTPGFKITLRGMQGEGEKHELERIDYRSIAQAEANLLEELLQS